MPITVIQEHDGIGEVAGSTLLKAKGTRIQEIEGFDYPHSLGFLWEVASGYLGFSTYDASIGHFNSLSIELVMTVFQVLAALNFATHYLAWSQRGVGAYFRDAEAKAADVDRRLAGLETEISSLRADSKRECDNSHRGEPNISNQHSRAITQIFQEFFHYGQVVNYLLPSMFALNIIRNVSHWPGAIQSIHRNKVIKCIRLQVSQVFLHSCAFKLEGADRFAFLV